MVNWKDAAFIVFATWVLMSIGTLVKQRDWAKLRTDVMRRFDKLDQKLERISTQKTGYSARR